MAKFFVGLIALVCIISGAILTAAGITMGALFVLIFAVTYFLCEIVFLLIKLNATQEKIFSRVRYSDTP